jgi:hypothetical protein
MFNVINRKGEHLATLNHCLDADGFRDIGERQTFLDPLNKQSPYSKALLKLFRTKVMDADYALRLEKHLLIMRQKKRSNFLWKFLKKGIKNAMAVIFKIRF